MMKPAVVFAMRGLCRRPLQTTLLVFALSIALGATMTIMAVIAGMDVQVRNDLERVGLDVINIHVSPRLSNLVLSPLRVLDCTKIRETTGGIVAPFRASMGVGRILGNQQTTELLVLATTAEWGEIVPLELLEGRFFRAGERGVCVLDQWVKESLLGPNEAAVGRMLNVRRRNSSIKLRVVGVMRDPFAIRKRFDELDVTGSARSSIFRMMEFKSIYAPGQFSQPSRRIHGVVLKVTPPQDPIHISRQLSQQLFNNDRIWVWARKEWVGYVLEAAGLGLQIANVIWIIVLIVTGIMIMTVSLVAVRERFREIAIRRTEGARRGQIVLQLLLENVLLSALAGCVALGLARWAGHLLESRYLSWPPAFLVSDMLLTLGCGIFIGALATVLPAMHAGNVDPVTVLRNA